MKSKILLSVLTIASLQLNAQRHQQTTAYALTASEKGNSSWNEVRLIDLNTGQELKRVFSSADNPEILNARTGKPVVKKDQTIAAEPETKRIVIYRNPIQSDGTPAQGAQSRPIYMERKVYHRYAPVKMDKPFSTNSAACAYDKKHDRLYFTPMGINQLRYIDLKAKTPTVYYFEDEPFGVVSGQWDVKNQVTRMVIVDGIGYALSNNAAHLLRFTTNKRAEITDLGAIADDEADDTHSISSSMSHGGDMIADEKGDLYVITANRAVFKIDVRALKATYKGAITGLPRGFSTNGATVEKGTSIIVSSANSTEGYYRFDLVTLQAEKINNDGTVFNASDLAGSALATAEKKDNKAPEQLSIPVIAEERITNKLQRTAFSVYPNPARSGSDVRVSFSNQAAGRYTLQLLDIGGQLIDSRQISIAGKMQVQNYSLPKNLARGTYLLKVVGETQSQTGISSIIVQ
ncbi:T9SS type A sorting domain-containing protein [Segetibacter sp. 3557_3]|uniref:T9SS type A sorting domain-containing protein n=1 Tax=Segetibacter sp. 3557_3 TaxID=2547429 RepID=UPI001058C61F|nr:T9SS type A sorting domain-containing protein [Segetibacter sp. 3557_3]TDH25558.1 T9SS type A sorting domain-containing protein [Segetibacter sp. 3557_3]